MVNQFKSILSKLVLAKKKNKKIIEINYIKSNKKILNLLWYNNFIYGYYIILNANNWKYKIFIKFSEIYCFFKKKTYLKSIISYKNLKLISLLENNYNYFLINDKGFFSIKESLKFKVGGFIFFKI